MRRADPRGPGAPTALAVTDYTLASALGTGRAATLAALRGGGSGLRRKAAGTAGPATWTGEVRDIDRQRLPQRLAAHESRTRRLAWLGLQADGFANSVVLARERHGPGRVGVFLGGASHFLHAEQACRDCSPTGGLPADSCACGGGASVASFVREALALSGPCAMVSTACSSAARAFSHAARLLALGEIDAAVVGGVDSLCAGTLRGFDSLELLSPDICRPWDAGRRGISLGEGAAFALLERGSGGDGVKPPPAWLLAVGESSASNHLGSTRPDGAGLEAAMRSALSLARLAPADVDYLNLHGIGMPCLDAAEDRAVRSVFGDALPCSSTKGATGYTLGAAGGIEASISMLALRHGLMPGGLNRREFDTRLRSRYLDAPRGAELRRVACNSAGFGGFNACLLLGAEPPSPGAS